MLANFICLLSLLQCSVPQAYFNIAWLPLKHISLLSSPSHLVLFRFLFSPFPYYSPSPSPPPALLLLSMWILLICLGAQLHKSSPHLLLLLLLLVLLHLLPLLPILHLPIVLPIVLPKVQTSRPGSQYLVVQI